MLYSCTTFLYCIVFFLLMFFWKEAGQQKGSLTYFTIHLHGHPVSSSFPLSPPLCSFTFSRRTDGRKAAWHSFLMVQLSGRGASSWFMVPTLQGGATGARWLFPAPGSMLPHWGGLKWEKVSNCRKARKSQGMTLEGKQSTTTATTLKPLLLQADEALTWADLCPLSPSSPPSPSNPKTPRQAKPGAPGASESSSTSS